MEEGIAIHFIRENMGVEGLPSHMKSNGRAIWARSVEKVKSVCDGIERRGYLWAISNSRKVKRGANVQLIHYDPSKEEDASRSIANFEQGIGIEDFKEKFPNTVNEKSSSLKTYSRFLGVEVKREFWMTLEKKSEGKGEYKIEFYQEHCDESGKSASYPVGYEANVGRGLTEFEIIAESTEEKGDTTDVDRSVEKEEDLLSDRKSSEDKKDPADLFRLVNKAEEGGHIDSSVDGLAANAGTVADPEGDSHKNGILAASLVALVALGVIGSLYFTGSYPFRAQKI